MRQWVRWIVRNEVLLFWRTARRRDRREAEHGVLALHHQDRTPEDELASRELFHHLMDQIPEDERRVVVLVALDRRTFRDVARREGVSLATAHARYRAGMKAFHEAAGRWSKAHDSLGLAPLPIALGAMPAAAQRVTGLDPAGWDGRRASWPRARWGSFLETLASGAAAGLFAGVMLGRASAGAPQMMPAAEADLRAPEAMIAPTATTTAQPTEAVTEAPVVTKAPRAVARAAAGSRAPVFAGPPDAPAPPDADVAALAALRVEQALLDRGREALDHDEFAEALSAVAEHARRFPHGQGAPQREHLREDACAGLGDSAGPLCESTH